MTETIKQIPRTLSVLTGNESIEGQDATGSFQVPSQSIANLVSGSSGANPTATGGPAAVNGSATTFLRSDGCPAIQKGSNAQLGLVQGDGTTFTIDGSGVGHATSTGTNVSSQANTAYTAVIGDANTWINFTNSANVTFTIPANASVAFPIGTSIAGSQDSTGVVHIVGAGGVTIKSAGNLANTNGQNATFETTKVASDTWKLYGNLVT